MLTKNSYIGDPSSGTTDPVDKTINTYKNYLNT